MTLSNLQVQFCTWFSSRRLEARAAAGHPDPFPCSKGDAFGHGMVTGGAQIGSG